jgi:hypothetical protein
MFLQIVVVVGLGASGVDIAREISQVAKEVHIASRNNEHRLGKIDLYPNVWMHAEVQNSELSYSYQGDKHPQLNLMIRWTASKMMSRCASLKVQQWQQTRSSTAQGTITASRSWTWTSSPSTRTTVSGLCTSTSSPQNTRPISPSSDCLPRYGPNLPRHHKVQSFIECGGSQSS